MDLSIIVPVYNTPIPFLKECLNSIANCKIKYNYEIIIVNDGSCAQETFDFLHRYSESHTTVIHQSNKGVSSARNTGLCKAIGELTLFLDSDDILLPAVNNAIKFLIETKEYSVVYSDTEFFGSAKFYDRKGNFSLFRLIYISNFLTISSLCRTSALKPFQFDEGMSYAEDYDLWCKMAAQHHLFKYIETPFHRYRRINDGQSLSQIQKGEKDKAIAKIRSQFSMEQIVTAENVNFFILNNFTDYKKNLFKLILFVFFPPFYKLLKRLKVYKNDAVIS